MLLSGKEESSKKSRETERTHRKKPFQKKADRNHTLKRKNPGCFTAS